MKHKVLVADPNCKYCCGHGVRIIKELAPGATPRIGGPNNYRKRRNICICVKGEDLQEVFEINALAVEFIKASTALYEIQTRDKLEDPEEEFNAMEKENEAYDKLKNAVTSRLRK